MPPRKRTKPVAEHIEATAQSSPAQSATEPSIPQDATAEHSASEGPDIFDQIIEARKKGLFEMSEQSAPIVPDTVARVETAMAAAPVMRASELEHSAREPSHHEQEPPAKRAPEMPKISDRLPDPRSIDQIRLDNDRNGPTMRLLRSNRHRDVWIQFDKNPGKEITDQIKAEGFRWEPRPEVGERKGAWVKPLEPGREIRIMLDAERLFLDLGNQIRQSKGLDPVGQTGPGPG